jgi:hypothetical protein
MVRISDSSPRKTACIPDDCWNAVGESWSGVVVVFPELLRLACGRGVGLPDSPEGVGSSSTGREGSDLSNESIGEAVLLVGVL